MTNEWEVNPVGMWFNNRVVTDRNANLNKHNVLFLATDKASGNTARIRRYF